MTVGYVYRVEKIVSEVFKEKCFGLWHKCFKIGEKVFGVEVKLEANISRK